MQLQPKRFGVSFKNEEFELIYTAASKDFQQLISLDQFIELGQHFNVDVKCYELAFQNNFQQLQNYMWLDDRKQKAIVVSFDEHYQIQGLYLKPYTTYPDSDKRYTKNTYRMPISEEWFVFWGGSNELLNYHYVYENQRYAYDLVQMKDGVSYKNTLLHNESYYAFGQDVVAPASGEVVQVIDGIKDNVPGEMDAANLAGNIVVIQHEHEEYSLLAHLKKDSVKVQVGERVTEGQLIGQCGNSGHSSEPHIHFQVMDQADFEQAVSIRIQFHDGYEPIQGDVVKGSVFKDIVFNS